MKKIIFVSLLFFCFAFKGFVQQKPKAVYKVGPARVVVWLSKNKDGEIGRDFKVEKEYVQAGQVKTTDHFNERELMQLKSAIDKALSAERVRVAETDE